MFLSCLTSLITFDKEDTVKKELDNAHKPAFLLIQFLTLLERNPPADAAAAPPLSNQSPPPILEAHKPRVQQALQGVPEDPGADRSRRPLPRSPEQDRRGDQRERGVPRHVEHHDRPGVPPAVGALLQLPGGRVPPQGCGRRRAQQAPGRGPPREEREAPIGRVAAGATVVVVEEGGEGPVGARRGGVAAFAPPNGAGILHWGSSEAGPGEFCGRNGAVENKNDEFFWKREGRKQRPGEQFGVRAIK